MMEKMGWCFVVQLLLLQVPLAVMYTQDQGSGDSTVVAVNNISAPAGSQTVLQCQSQRMVWTQDRLHDRQRVVHWDLYSTGREYKVERLLDMFSAGDQRIYNSYNQGRMSMISTAFADGNFSLIIKDVASSDKGIYSCNLHHHYCHLYESTKVQLNITKSARKERRYWDGDKVVVMALVGSTVLLPCVNRRQVWTERNSEEEQQVVHWDRQPPGVWHDRADRLIDLYASGERRSYGPLFLRQKMNISEQAFSYGDFSLTISNLQPSDEGIYSCHLHHHYCGLHERRVFLLGISPPIIKNQTSVTQTAAATQQDIAVEEGPRVINVILPERPTHFLQQLGYILATLLLLALTVTAILLLPRRCRKRGRDYDVQKMEGQQMNTNHFAVDTAELKVCNEEVKLDYKNNIMKERAELAKLPPPKFIDVDDEPNKSYWK
ncbi:matrix remodeling-associated protein 8-like isoform X1 [Polypterus senegalus]|uniref:matrix remodeling-associated protein 8-like isoform X1 n=1 Tax=Polypterus senegalus TaxID=55291 RepID=UPI001963964C|nr:matrix remodeling-associated protein 8-like isoform X1 [Polypterus senegalus]